MKTPLFKLSQWTQVKSLESLKDKYSWWIQKLSEIQKINTITCERKRKLSWKNQVTESHKYKKSKWCSRGTPIFCVNLVLVFKAPSINHNLFCLRLSLICRRSISYCKFFKNGDECWIRNVLVTILRCWSRFWQFRPWKSLNKSVGHQHPKDVTNILILSPTVSHQHHNVSNMTVAEPKSWKSIQRIFSG